PPSSATVTIAVTSVVTCLRADKEACKPCPPPSATTRGGRSSSPSSTAVVLDIVEACPLVPCCARTCGHTRPGRWAPVVPRPGPRRASAAAGTDTGILLPAHIPVDHVHLHPLAAEALGELLGHRHTAVLTAGASHGQGHVVLALALVTGSGDLEDLT